MKSNVTVSGELTVFTVHALRPQLLSALNTSGYLQVDLRDVSEVDGAGIQLLMAAKREAAQRNAAFHLIAPPPNVMATLELTDLIKELGDHVVHEPESKA